MKAADHRQWGATQEHGEHYKHNYQKKLGNKATFKQHVIYPINKHYAKFAQLHALTELTLM